jgi:hypothetical protein
MGSQTICWIGLEPVQISAFQVVRIIGVRHCTWYKRCIEERLDRIQWSCIWEGEKSPKVMLMIVICGRQGKGDSPQEGGMGG